jgi:hypothetical protein
MVVSAGGIGRELGPPLLKPLERDQRVELDLVLGVAGLVV